MKNIKGFLTALLSSLGLILTVLGSGGLIATGAYMLNSFLGLAPNAADWQYGLTGLIYIVSMIPSTVISIRVYWNAYYN